MSFDEESSLYVFHSGGTDTPSITPTPEPEPVDQALEQKVFFYYIPESFRQTFFPEYVQLTDVFLDAPNLKDRIDTLGIFLYEPMGEVRGRMKKKNIHLF